MRGGWSPSSTTGFDIANGKPPGVFQFNTFGFADNIGTADPPIDLWNGFQIDALTDFIFSTTADIDTISSSDANDTEPVFIFGLDANRVWTTQTITLNGQNKVPLTTPLIRVNRLTNIGTTNIVGVVRIYVDGAITAGVPDDLSTVRGYINMGDNISQSSLFSGPSNFDVKLLNSRCNIGRAAGGGTARLADVETRFMPLTGINILSGLHFTLHSSGTSLAGFDSPVPANLGSNFDIFWRTTEVSTNGTLLNCSFNFLLYPL